MAASCKAWLRQGNDGYAGFTLIEMLVVLAILALAAATGAIGFRDAKGTTRLRPFAAQIAGELKATRAHAVLSGQPAAFVLDGATRTYHIAGVSGARRLPDQVAMSVRTAQGGSAGRIDFYPDGSSSGAAVTLSLGGAAIVLDVEWLTGAVLIRPAQS